ncbi:MAG: hypothetical protein GWM90_03580, partial [Gemmatimonadetes bacterium]|nr:hypothetical protein [Gemmatimonadota bacterium]NIQ52730.1 hypothetical protein [Gemmatimonadota bacterium]NIU72870.1 hypothetical protein [Gammaproteobacteria bacterium]NIX43231.1 hypothetical protein [Gemmatimonadota bacterium]NIY07405.1 hypothetical protein [Gemmatimonadota bacterium]
MDSGRAQVGAMLSTDWTAWIDWPVLVGNLVRIAFILLLAFGAYRVLKLFTARLQRE